jgi:Ala-tRNA(Pro) deacylase
MPAQKLKQFLDAHGVAYHSIPHYVAYTAQETAAAAHVHGRELAKTVMVNLDGSLAMVVLPATSKIDLDLLRHAAGAEAAGLASEREFKDRFPDCQPGAMPPFGNLYDMRVFADASLGEDEQIAFNAGTHEELIRMAYADFQRHVQPIVADIAYHARQPV